jgi:hypothetical protein
VQSFLAFVEEGMRSWMRDLIQSRVFSPEQYIKISRQIDASHRHDYTEIMEDPWLQAAIEAAGGEIPSWWDPFDNPVGEMRRI